MQKKTLVFLSACLFILSTMLGGCTNMQDKTVATNKNYPDRPITLIVPFGVGGGMDLVARLLEKSAPAKLGQPLVIVNKPGAAGALGWNELAGSAPDGYTVGMTGIELLLQPLYGPTKYYYPTALDPLIQIIESPMIMVIQSDQPWKNTNDLIVYAMQYPGKIKFGHSGIGGMAHVAGESFAKNSNIQLEQVPFQSAAEEMAGLLGGHIQIAFLSPASIKEQMKSGTIRALAIASEHRLTDPIFATIPTFNEQQLQVVGHSWYGIAAPKELSAEVKNKLTDGLKAMINDPEFKKNIESLGLEVNYLGPKETQEKWLDESEKLTKTVQETGILDKIKEQKK